MNDDFDAAPASQKCAVNLRLLTSPPDPRAFDGKINDETGECLGRWRAILCCSPEDIPLNFERSTIFDKIPYDGGSAIAYLEFLRIEPGHRIRGYGTAALEGFYREAREQTAALAFALVGRTAASEDDLDTNIAFYRSRGWVFLDLPNAHAAQFAYFLL